MRKKNKVKEFEDEIRKKFEAGQDLITLSIEYKISYQVLKNLSSKNKWEKGKLKSLLIAQETLELLKNNRGVREEVREQYARLTKELREHLTNTDNPTRMKEEIALSNRVKALKDLYSIDKELHGLQTDSELLEYQRVMVELEKLKNTLEEGTAEGQPKELI